MNERKHAQMARALIAACGGLEEAASECRVSLTNLSRYQTPGSGCFMPADVMADLEAYAGAPLYSRAIFEARPASTVPADLMTEACEAAESTSDLQRKIRLAARDGVLTPRELDELATEHAAAEAELRQVGAVIERAREAG